MIERTFSLNHEEVLSSLSELANIAYDYIEYTLNIPNEQWNLEMMLYEEQENLTDEFRKVNKLESEWMYYKHGYFMQLKNYCLERFLWQKITTKEETAKLISFFCNSDCEKKLDFIQESVSDWYSDNIEGKAHQPITFEFKQVKSKETTNDVIVCKCNVGDSKLSLDIILEN